MNTAHARLNDLMLNDRGFVFDPNTGDSYQVNETGLTILRGLQHDATAAALLDEIVATREVDPLAARSDLDAFLWELSRLGWL